jgi:TatD DNase family protein
MIDFHSHLDLYKNPISLLAEINKRCRFVLAVTTSPRAWIKASQVFSGIDCISVGLGMHPEVLKNKKNEYELFFSNISKCSYIGEIGLDGFTQNKSSLAEQMEFFRMTLQKSEQCGGKIMSIHSRNASKPVLQIIEQHLQKSIPVLHWFSGSIKELEWAISLGCWFSINPIMLLNSKGQYIVENIPLSRIVPETDGPFTSHDGIPYMPWDTNLVIDGISGIYNLTNIDISKTMVENLNVLCAGIQQY